MSRRASRRRQQAMNARRRSVRPRLWVPMWPRLNGKTTLRAALTESPDLADAMAYTLTCPRPIRAIAPPPAWMLPYLGTNASGPVDAGW